ncbi:MAG: 50S ribosomal protein L9 [Ruminococcaceae bacterium]|nr:50S ribosomal protein L9 [Oscillospiraceae bacterium]
MKVILKKDVKDLGKKDQVVNVSDGYANNFLFPRGIAVPATAGGLNDVKNKQQAAEEKKKREIAAAKELVAALKDKEVVIKLKCGAGGKLFGAVSSKEVAQELKKQHGFDLDKKDLVIKEPIKNLGVYNVEAKVYTGITAEFKVKVESL